MKQHFQSFVLIYLLLFQLAWGVEPPTTDWIEPLVLSSSTYQKLKTAHARKGQARICWFVDGSEGEKKIIYVGENHPDHTVRLETLRVCKTGEVEIMTYDQAGEILWIPDRKSGSVNSAHPH